MQSFTQRVGRRALVVSWLLLAGLTGGDRLHSGAAATAELEYRWVGSAVVVMHGPKIGGDGDLASTWNLALRWRETGRVPVKDERGRLTGEFVLLEDDGSSWSGTREGFLVSHSNCSKTTFTYSGEGQGQRSIDFGWMYFSLVDDDPLSEWFKDGTYYVSSGQTLQFITGPTTRTVHDTCRGGSTITESIDRLLPLSFSMGREFFSPLAGTAEFSVEQLRQTMSQVAQFQSLPVRYVDVERRQTNGEKLTGSYESVGDPTLSWQVNWNVERRLSIEPLLETVDRDWLPQGGNESNRVRATASINPAYGLEGKFRFRLEEVTAEPGHAMNRGDESESDLDLEFVAGTGWEPPVAIAGGWEIASTELTQEATVELESSDYGAWAKLTCSVEIDGVQYDCRSEAGQDFVTVPHDEQDDRIADAWQENHDAKGREATWDEDDQPSGQASTGDGLSLYEEYRGFFEERGTHRRLDPHRKEIFVRDEDGLIADSGFANISQLEVVFIDDDGWTGPDPLHSWMSADLDKRRVNHRTSGYAHLVDQHALHLELSTLGLSALGNQVKSLLAVDENFNFDPKALEESRLLGFKFGGVGGSPARAARIQIYEDEIKIEAQEAVRGAWAFALSVQEENTDYFKSQCPAYVQQMESEAATVAATLIRNTSLHEAGHGLGASHHSPSAYSGDANCVMKYFSTYLKLTCGCAAFCVDAQEPWPTQYSRSECWGQLQVSDNL